MKQNKIRKCKRLNKAKRICEKLVNKHREAYCIVFEANRYYIMSEDIYISVWEKFCKDKDNLMTLVKKQKYYSFDTDMV